jgi:lipid-A-disaccharide synthase
MKYYIISGEASGDLHGSNLVKELKRLDQNATVRAWGGDLMQAAGAEVVKHYRDLAFMGFTEVIKNLPTILNNLKFCKQDIEQFAPDVLVLIDYPGFNLRIAKWAKEKGYKVVYYISPQIWAWKESRVKTIKKSVDKMLVILPFEKEFYQKWDYQVEYIGHPLVQVIEDFKKQPVSLKTLTRTNEEISTSYKGIIALLPGSRQQEILVKLPIMLQTCRHFHQYQFVVAQAPGQPADLYEKLMAAYPNVTMAYQGQTYALLSQARAALVTSGTATLETALFGVPEVVCYKGSSISYQIAKRLVKIKYISLVNLIMDKKVVTELIQNELTVENLLREMNKILYDEAHLQQLGKDYEDLRKKLEQGGNASAKAATEILDFMQATAS